MPMIILNTRIGRGLNLPKRAKQYPLNTMSFQTILFTVPGNVPTRCCRVVVTQLKDCMVFIERPLPYSIHTNAHPFNNGSCDILTPSQIRIYIAIHLQGDVAL